MPNRIPDLCTDCYHDSQNELDSASKVEPEPLQEIAVSISRNLDVSDTLSKRDNWPAWLVDGVEYLQSISKADEWVTLIAALVQLEKSLGFTGTVRWQ
jgi:hypothetical protein